MKQELIKPVVRVGNSAGIILPKEWLNGKARVELVEKPLNIKREVLEILYSYLHDVKGVYLVGSYAREEQTSRSDVDVLVITSKIRKKIEVGKYYFILIPEEELKNELNKNALPFVPMLKEAKTIINEKLIENYVNISPTKKNLKNRIELSKSALSIDKEMIELDREWPSKCSDAVAYSLILNLRTIYIVDKLRKNREISNKELKQLIKKISGSLNAYEGYLRVKNNEKEKEALPVEEADKLHRYAIEKLEEVENWLKERKD